MFDFIWNQWEVRIGLEAVVALFLMSFSGLLSLLWLALVVANEVHRWKYGKDPDLEKEIYAILESFKK